MVITSLILLFLNYYSASTTRKLMFQAKYASAQDKLQLITSSFGGVDSLTQENVEQVVAVLGDMNVTRLVITDGAGTALYDSSVNQNAAGKIILFPPVVLALQGNDVFQCYYRSGALESYAAMPVMSYDAPVGCVYIMEYDAEQGQIISNLEVNILRSSVIMEATIIIFSIIFSFVSSGRMRQILTSIRMVREGEYSYKIHMHGTDEYHTLATEFNKLTDKLQESENAQRQFVSDASHELKTPLASIKLLSDSIMQNEMDLDTMREFVADIGSEADRLTRMTQKLLTLSKSDAEGIQQEHEVVDMSQSVSRVFRMLVPLAESKKIRLTGQLQLDCTVLCVEDDMYQIVFNLVENAIKYNTDNGSVHVTVSRGEEDVTLLVEDSGVGIPDDAVEHIFERFYRVDKARSRQAGGSGLGLSIVHDLVERNLGTIGVAPREEKGTCFTVVFPLFEVGEEEDAHA